MKTSIRLHFALMCNRSNGGFFSALTLIDALRPLVDLTVWNLVPSRYPGLEQCFSTRDLNLLTARPCVHIEPGEHVFFYMNEYPTLWQNYSQEWQQALRNAGSAQIAFNRTVGTLPLEIWLAPQLTQVYFQDRAMQHEWAALVDDSPLCRVPSRILPPPVDLSEFLTDKKRADSQRQSRIIVGRLAGDGDVPENALDFYTKLAATLPEAEFWFMPAPEQLANELKDHAQFRFFAPNEISPQEFLQATDIYLLSYAPGVPIPGPRSLVEAMAAGCAPVVVNRDGPQQRVVHGESGFCFDTDQECVTQVTQLAHDIELRHKIAKAARARAVSFKLSDWTDLILEHCVTKR